MVMQRLEDWSPALLLVIGIAMVTVAAAAGLPEGLAVTFAVLGTGLICLGALMRVLEGSVEVGPRGFKAHLRERRAEVVDVVERVRPEARFAVEDLLDYVLRGDETVVIDDTTGKVSVYDTKGSPAVTYDSASDQVWVEWLRNLDVGDPPETKPGRRGE